MDQEYIVSGVCEVAGVPPGERVTRSQVEAWGGPHAQVNVEAIIAGGHLTPVEADAKPAKQLKAEAGKP